MTILFAVTLFLSAALMFWAEPMFGKMALPFLGGSPSVWNTCMVFYQSILLLGYSYAHFLARMQNALLQKIGYAVVILFGLTVLPIAIPASAAPESSNPYLWLTGLLARSLGLPFLALAATSPLLQRWYAMTPGQSAKDPYFLFAASNAGSFAALLAYPLLIERLLPLHAQAVVWTAGYSILIVLTMVCAAQAKGNAQVETSESADGAVPITSSDRLWWLVLSMLPSSLLLGVTSYLSIDIAPVPLLWVIPLALYLLTFVIAFGRTSAPVVISPLVLATTTGAALFLQSTSITEPLWMIMLLHLCAFSLLALACHTKLAQRRPPTKHLTQFYFFVALGGALGGLLNAIVAPAIFDSIIEYPLALVLAFAVVSITSRAQLSRMDFLAPLAVVAISLIGALIVQNVASFGASVSLGRLFMFAFIACFLFAKEPPRAAIAFVMIFLVGLLLPRDLGNIIVKERNFFGLKKVLQQGNDFHWLVHGTTYHGGQALRPDRSAEPLTYYHPTGPLGELFKALYQSDRVRTVGVIGLGVGAMSYYARPDQKWTYFEIDPAIANIAENKELFTFLQRSPVKIPIVLGDARLSLQRQPDKNYDLLVVDAFGSDAIPVHLITREAVELYKQKLNEHGLLLFHISNENYRLGPVLANIAAATGLSVIAREHDVDENEFARGLFPSHWVLMYRDPADVAPLLSAGSKWKTLTPSVDRQPWTDDYSDVLSAVKWVK